MLQEVKNALRVASDAFDADLTQLINAALLDLSVAGVTAGTDPETITDPLVIRAVCTYCAANRISMDPQQRAWLKASYDEQKAQMQTATGYTDWGDGNEG